MRYFALLLDPNDHGIGEDVRRSYEAIPRRRGLEFEWQPFDHAAVLTAWDDDWGDPLVVEEGSWLAAGMVRLDNRADVERWADCKGEELTDLGLVLRVVALHGTKYISQLLGDFAFAAWNATKRTAVAACDAFAVKRLYYSKRGHLFTFASRAEALASGQHYEVQYLTELLVRSEPPHNLTVYAGVQPVPPASLAVLERGCLAIESYWNPADFAMHDSSAETEQDASGACRELLAASVRSRLGGPGETWAQLSGGLDSSSIVSLSQWLAERGEAPYGLAGTVTIVDREGAIADERAYSDAVLRRWPLRNEAIVDSPTWLEEGYAPPTTDQPRFDLAVSPRDRRMCAVVRRAGGRVLLTGWGGDEIFLGNMLFFADWITQGRIWAAVREMARRAAIGRVSFWELAYRNGLLPLLPRVAQRWLVHNTHDAPAQPWLQPAMMRRCGLRWQSPSVPEYGGRNGRAYRHAVAAKILSLPTVTDPGLTVDMLDVRHPLLYRPLVEFALRLPPEFRARPHAHRWIFREAMRDILPQEVRTRIGKPHVGDLLARSLTIQQHRLAPLLDNPILAQLGIVDRTKLRAAFETAPCNTRVGESMHLPLLSTLAVEAWLQIRSGRWPHGGHHSSCEAPTHFHSPLLRGA